VDAWPSDNPYDPLIQMIERQTELIERLTQVVIQRQTDLMIERQIATTPDEGARSTRAALGDSFTDLGKATIAGLLVQVDQQRISLQAHVGQNSLSRVSCSCFVTVVNNIRGWLHPRKMASDSTFLRSSSRLGVRPVLSPASPGPHVDDPVE
jgi:hypothetical protein